MIKRILSCLLLLGLCVSMGQAKVHWISRNLSFDDTYIGGPGHSFLIIIPDKPATIKQKFSWYTQHERELGCGHKGITLSGVRDGWDLVAAINEKKDLKAAYTYFCKSKKEKERVGVKANTITLASSLDDSTLISNLFVRTTAYRQKTPLSYTPFENNCNAFALSILSYSGAIDTNGTLLNRTLPGIDILLPFSYFETKGEKKEMQNFFLRCANTLQKKVEKVYTEHIRKEAERRLRDRIGPHVPF